MMSLVILYKEIYCLNSEPEISHKNIHLNNIYYGFTIRDCILENDKLCK